MYVYEAVAGALVRAGVTDVFGLMGDGNLRIISEMSSEGAIRYFGTRHEATAVAMAEGYARSTGRVGVCTVTQGPGLTNTLTAVTGARDARTPIVMIAGDTRTSLPGHYQAIDQEAVFAVAGAGVQPIRSPRRIMEDVDRAFRRAVREQRPIGLFMTGTFQDSIADQPPDAPLYPPDRVVTIPSTQAICDVVDLIDSASRPIVLAGLGAVKAGAGPALCALAEQIGALLYTTVRAKGLFSGQQFDMGIFGDLATDMGSEFIGKADLVISFGASLNPFTTCYNSLFRDGELLVQVDEDATAIGRYTNTTYGVVGDAKEAARMLLDQLRERRPTALTAYRRPDVVERLANFRIEDEFRPVHHDSLADPRALMVALESILPRERTVAIDGGHFTGFPTTYLSVPDASALLFAVNFGAIGLSLGTGMGGAVGRPDRMAVVVVGDGGLMMSLADLDTAVRYRLPVLVVVMNDGAFGAEVHTLRMFDLPDDAAFHNDPDFAAISRAMGAKAVTVRSPDEFGQIAAWIASPDGPMVVDCKVNVEVRAAWIEEANRPVVRARQRVRSA